MGHLPTVKQARIKKQASFFKITKKFA